MELIEQKKPKKRLIFCSDGTWQKLSSGYPTNVVKIAQAIKPSSADGTSQIVFYDEGIGSGNVAGEWLAKADRILGGAIGAGIDQNIQDGYRFLSLNYEPGDEIYLFGFSRGAYTVRSLAGLIYSAGGLLSLANIRETPFVYDLYQNKTLKVDDKRIFRKLPIPYEYSPNLKKIQDARKEAEYILSSNSQLPFDQKQEKVSELIKKYGLKEREDDQIRQKAKITLLGCWDTVGALGVPISIPFLNELFNKKHQFHDTELNRDILYAFHAIAIDERRKVFDVTPMTKSTKVDSQILRQAWFPGGHGSVGGGDKNDRSLADGALKWMIEQIKEHGLGLEFDPEKVEDGVKPNPTGNFNISSDLLDVLGTIHRNIPKQQFDVLHQSTKERWRDVSTYRPEHLKAAYEKELNEWAQNNPKKAD